MCSRYRIDGLQYANWSERIFREMREGGVHAVHETISYHESFREMVLNIQKWNRWCEQYPARIFIGRTGGDVRRAVEEGRTAIFLGFQNPSPNVVERPSTRRVPVTARPPAISPTTTPATSV